MIIKYIRLNQTVFHWSWSGQLFYYTYAPSWCKGNIWTKSQNQAIILRDVLTRHGNNALQKSSCTSTGVLSQTPSQKEEQNMMGSSGKSKEDRISYFPSWTHLWLQISKDLHTLAQWILSWWQARNDKPERVRARSLLAVSTTALYIYIYIYIYICVCVCVCVCVCCLYFLPVHTSLIYLYILYCM